VESSIQKDQWVWVVVQDSGGKEQFLGEHDEERNEAFIPAFLEKEEALQGLKLLPRSQEHKCEVQAIQLDDLAQRAGESGFMVWILSGTGQVLERVKP